MGVAVCSLGYQLRWNIKQWIWGLPEDTIELQIRESLRRDGPAARPPSISSPQELAERAVFMDVLSARRADVLVLPFNPAQAVSLDRTARSLMTYRLAQAIEGRTELKVADPGIVMRALGLQRRNYESEHALELAKALGARWVIDAEVTRPVARIPEDTPLVYSVSLRCAPPDGLATARRIIVPDIAFSDELPPEEAFRAVIGQILEQLPLGPLKPAPELVAAEPLSGRLSAAPFSLASELAKSPLDRSLQLQLFASFHPARAVHGELLWERSLIALDRVSPGSPDYQLLRARAYHHLGRRPYALVLLGQAGNSATSPASAALRAFLDGNLPALEQARAEIRDPALQLMSEIETEDVRLAYAKQTGYQVL